MLKINVVIFIAILLVYVSALKYPEHNYGSIKFCNKFNSTNNPKLDAYIRVLVDSWLLIKNLEKYKGDEFGSKFIIYEFMEYPQLRTKFPWAANLTTRTQMSKSEYLKGLGVANAKSLDVIIGKLSCGDIDGAKKIVYEIGFRHKNYNVTILDIAPFKTVFLGAIQNALGKQYFSTVADTWSAGLDYLATGFLSGLLA